MPSLFTGSSPVNRYVADGNGYIHDLLAVEPQCLDLMVRGRWWGGDLHTLAVAILLGFALCPRCMTRSAAIVRDVE